MRDAPGSCGLGIRCRKRLSQSCLRTRLRCTRSADARTRRAANHLRGRAERQSDPRAVGETHGLPRHSSSGHLRRRARPSRACVPSRLCAKPTLLCRLHVEQWAQYRGAIPLDRRQGDPLDAQVPARRSGSVREPQRWASGVRARREALHEHRRRRLRRRSRGQVAGHALAVRQAAGTRRLEACGEVDDRRARVEESLAVLLRSSDW